MVTVLQNIPHYSVFAALEVCMPQTHQTEGNAISNDHINGHISTML